MRSRNGSPRSRRFVMHARSRPRPPRLRLLRGAKPLLLRLKKDRLARARVAGDGARASSTHYTERSYVDRYEGASWLKRLKHRPPKRQRRQRVTPIVHHPADHAQGADPAARAKAGASTSGAKRFASSASRKSRVSTTRTFVCSPSLWRRVGRSFRVDPPCFALPTSVDSRAPSSRLQT